MAVWLGYISVMPVFVPLGETPSLALLNRSAKSAVGVPVQSALLADVMIVLNALTICSERPPCT